MAAPTLFDRFLRPILGRGGSRPERLATLALVLVAVVGFTIPEAWGQDDPRTAVQAYLAAAARGDAGAMLAASDVRTDLIGKVDVALLDQAALKAALPTLLGNPTSISVGPASSTLPVSVGASYRAGDATHQVRLTLDRVFPLLRIHAAWKVKVVPAVLKTQVPAAAGDLTVDGRRVAGSAGKPMTIAVFPGQHVLSVSGGELLADQGSPYDSEVPSLANGVVALRLTPAGEAASAKAVVASFATCVASRSNCAPEDFGAGTQAALQLVGDPSSGTAVKPDSTGAVIVVGHVQLIETVGSGTLATHSPVGGGYVLKLTPSGDHFTAGSISYQPSAPGATRPAGATDQAILGVVGPALQKCIATAEANPPDCPQAVYASASNVQWTLQGDPLAGATLSFDPSLSLFKVQGRMTVGLSYDSSILGVGLHNDTSEVVPYTAELFWDGQKPVLVAILGSRNGG